MTFTISKNHISSFKNASTATSFAAFRIHHCPGLFFNKSRHNFNHSNLSKSGFSKVSFQSSMMLRLLVFIDNFSGNQSTCSIGTLMSGGLIAASVFQSI